MTSQRTTTYLARSLRLQRLVRVTLLVLILGQLLTAHAVAADNKTTPAADERPVITQTNLRELPKLIEQGADVNQHI